MENSHIMRYLCLICCLYVFFSYVTCHTFRTDSFEWDGGTLRLDHIHDSLSVIRYEKHGKELSSWELPYPVYRFDWGDLTGDGVPEIAVGVVKPTRFFPTPAKRLFLFKLYHGKLIRPLWLGSHVAHELVDFHIERDSVPALIHTVELLPDGSQVRCEYRQHGFGIKFVKLLPN
ncbi:MAG: nuclear receptor-binding factor 2 [Bacteroidaceae bacterium]|nr:nuclear receptor-binding factor 2 [Bacteroidaceae bacterium]